MFSEKLEKTERSLNQTDLKKLDQQRTQWTKKSWIIKIQQGFVYRCRNSPLHLRQPS